MPKSLQTQSGWRLGLAGLAMVSLSLPVLAQFRGTFPPPGDMINPGDTPPAPTVTTDPTLDRPNFRFTGSVSATSNPINTAQFFPQIQPTLRPRSIVRANPKLQNWGDMRQLANNPLRAGLPTGQPGAGLKQKFPGIGFTGPIPPDPDIAVGPSDIVQVVNGGIAFFRKSNGSRYFQVSDSNTAFWAGMGAPDFIFDPKVFFDPGTQRFYMVYLALDDPNQKSYLLIAVSDDANPSGTWNRYRIDVTGTAGGNATWFDYPGFGFNRDAVVISGNMFGFTAGSFGSRIVALHKATLAAGGAINAKISDAPGTFTFQVARTVDPTMSKLPMVARRGFSSSFLTLANVADVTNTVGEAPTITTTNITVPTYNGHFTDATSFGRVLDTIGDRMMTAYARNNRVYAVHTTNAASGRAQVSWYEIDLATWPASGNPATLQSGNITNGANDVYMPSIAASANGDISILATRSGDTLRPELVFWTQETGAAAGTVNGPTLLAASSGPPHNFFRFGDYSDIEIDPDDDSTFWGVGNNFGGGNWTTDIGNWILTRVDTVLPGSVTLLQGTNIGGNAAALNAAGDGQRLRVQSQLVNRVGQVSLQTVGFTTTAVPNRIKFIDIQATALVENRPFVSGSLLVKNINTGRFEIVRSFQLLGGDSTVKFRILSTQLANYVTAGGVIEVQIRSFESISRFRGTPGSHVLSIDEMKLEVGHAG
ncbi:MAG: hypothetical protein MH204_08640 [Fimbriimonadaceae bacterium]|nr:hypothetical protein [Fimbriimonadaceae bacterium]